MFGGMGYSELIVIGIIALLLFGKNLPEVARSLGKGIVEFKKGMAGIEDEVRTASRPSYQSSRPVSRPTVNDDEAPEAVAPKFEPPTSEPREEATV